MFHPVGARPPSVYWRRRLMLVSALVVAIVLLVITLKALTSDGSTPVAGAHGHAPRPAHPPVAGPSNTSPPASTAPSGGTRGSSAPGRRTRSTTPPVSTPPVSTSPAGGSTSAAPARCTSAQLTIRAETDATSYPVGAQPVLSMLITNTGPAPCVQNLADSQVVLSVYNGAARVWGSHDCQIQPGTDDRTLAAGAPVKVNVTWSGLTSQPKCAGTRQRAGAGTYTLYPTLSGAKGTAAQFAIH